MPDCQGDIYIVRIPDYDDLVVGVFSSRENCEKFIENFPDANFEVSCRKLDDVLPAIRQDAKLKCRLFQDGKLIRSYEIKTFPAVLAKLGHQAYMSLGHSYVQEITLTTKDTNPQEIGND